MRATKQGGLVSVVGILSEDRAVNLVGPILFGAKIGGLYFLPSKLSSRWTLIADLSRAVRGVLGVSSTMVVKLLEFVWEQRIRPVIGREFEWKDAKQAFEHSIGWSGVVGDKKGEFNFEIDLTAIFESKLLQQQISTCCRV